ncbi:unnamed protein product [Moneuplotes crassus]|uniref:Uncharacterized protein n=1 Tax=Euplotes crassus TaxID=5936 RepID=A0AAD1Y0R1_EUPCR|nr:unnamed protein product [Moneuplotes crassus]
MNLSFLRDYGRISLSIAIIYQNLIPLVLLGTWKYEKEVHQAFIALLPSMADSISPYFTKCIILLQIIAGMMILCDECGKGAKTYLVSLLMLSVSQYNPLVTGIGQKALYRGLKHLSMYGLCILVDSLNSRITVHRFRNHLR